MVKRYIEFICLREVEVPQFLLDTLNSLEKALSKPLNLNLDKDCVKAFNSFTWVYRLPQVLS